MTERGQKLWSWLQGMYGKALVLEYGEVCPPAWEHAAGELTNDELRRGLMSLREIARTDAKAGRYPPKLPEFFALCRPAPQNMRAHRPIDQPALPPPTPEGRAIFAQAKAEALEKAEAAREQGLGTWDAARAALGNQQTPQAIAMRKDVARYERAALAAEERCE